jgi:hypothetical protein
VSLYYDTFLGKKKSPVNQIIVKKIIDIRNGWAYSLYTYFHIGFLDEVGRKGGRSPGSLWG